jgi:hypothetical protein
MIAGFFSEVKFFSACCNGYLVKINQVEKGRMIVTLYDPAGVRLFLPLVHFCEMEGIAHSYF